MDSHHRFEEVLAEGAVSVSGAVREFGVSRSTLYELMRSGRLPYCQPNGRRLIPRQAIRKLLAQTLVRNEGADAKGAALDTRSNPV